MLSDIEDRTLAMVEDDFFNFKTVRWVLCTFYERNVSFAEISSIVGHLSSLGLIRWRVIQRGRAYFRNHASQHAQRHCSTVFKATEMGKSYLQKPRQVA